MWRSKQITCKYKSRAYQSNTIKPFHSTVALQKGISFFFWQLGSYSTAPTYFKVNTARSLQSVVEAASLFKSSHSSLCTPSHAKQVGLSEHFLAKEAACCDCVLRCRLDSWTVRRSRLWSAIKPNDDSLLVQQKRTSLTKAHKLICRTKQNHTYEKVAPWDCESVAASGWFQASVSFHQRSWL